MDLQIFRIGFKVSCKEKARRIYISSLVSVEGSLVELTQYFISVINLFFSRVTPLSDPLFPLFCSCKGSQLADRDLSAMEVVFVLPTVYT